MNLSKNGANTFWLFLNFVKFHIRKNSRDNRSKSVVTILNALISQGSVAMQLRWDGMLCHRMHNFIWNILLKEKLPVK